MFTRKPDFKAADRPGFGDQIAGSGVDAAEVAHAMTERAGPVAFEAGSGDSVIGQDLTIEGQAITIRCKGSLRINGNIQAELHSRELTVGENGTVQGTIAADSVDVFGRVSGTIRGAKVTLHSSSEVDGDIHAGSLSMEEGASFDGRSRKAADAASVAPLLTGEARPAGGTTVPFPRNPASLQ